MPMTSVEHIRSKLLQLITKHEADKIELLDVLMKKWKGKENDLLKSLCERYKENYTKIRPIPIKKVYAIGSIPFGAGLQRKCKRRVDGVIFALEIINKRQLYKHDLMILESEINIMRQISHPNIIKLYDIFDSRGKICLILDFIKGGQLFDCIIEKEHFSEKDAAIFVAQICEALQYLHEKSIVYNNLQPQHLLFTTKEQGSRIKLINFHRAVSCKNGDLCTAMISYDNSIYIAPEILQKSKYGTPADMWSVGVILYIMLCGFPPFWHGLSTRNDQYVIFGFIRESQKCFPHQTNSFYIIPECIISVCLQYFGNHCNQYCFEKGRLYKKIIDAQYNMSSPYWHNISENAKDLIRKLLEIDPQKRLTATDTLKHVWLKCKMCDNTYLDCNHIIHLKRFQYIQRLRSGIRRILVIKRLIEVLQN